LEQGEKFKDYKKMKGFDINFISKQQLLGLEMEDVYIEDYYFCAALSKKGFCVFFFKFFKAFGSLQFPPNSVLTSIQIQSTVDNNGIHKSPPRIQRPRYLIQLTSNLNTDSTSIDKSFFFC
jgi:hypothetical protein